MSIKNPYRHPYPFGQHLLDRGGELGFDEGIKAANEDWIEWMGKFKTFDEFNLSTPIIIPQEKWQERKKSLEENK